ncbi:MAG: invasin domain 3-containing protein, partial [Desulfofundulus sp.]
MKKKLSVAMLVVFLLALAVFPAGAWAGKPAVPVQDVPAGQGNTVASQVYGNAATGQGSVVSQAYGDITGGQREEPGNGDEDLPGVLPVLRTEPSDGVTVVRPDAPIKIVFDTTSRAFRHVSEQLEKGHFYATINGQKADAVYDGQGTVEVKHGLLQRYTRYTVEFVLHPYDEGRHLGFEKNELSEGWEKKSCSFAFETGSALHEPRHAKFSLSSSNPRVTEGTELDATFTDDYGQPGYGAAGKVNLVEYGTRKPGSAVADPSGFTVPEGSDGTVKVRISDTEAEKVGVAVEVSGPYPEDTARYDGEINFRPGPAAKVTLSLGAERVVVGHTVAVSGTAVDVYENPVEDGTPVSAAATAGQVSSGASTAGGAFSLEFTAPTKKQPVTLTVKVDQCESELSIPVIADVPAKVTVTPEKQTALAGTQVNVNVLVQDQYGNAVEDGTAVTLAASGGTVTPVAAVTKDGAVNAQATSGQAGRVTVSASAGNGVSGSAVVNFVAVVPSGSQVKLNIMPDSTPGEYVVQGQVTKDGVPVSSVAIPLVVKNGTLSDPIPVTDQQGGFSTTLRVTGSGCTSVAVDSTQAPGVSSGTVGVDPLVYGNQPWTDTGIDVGSGLLVRVNATGTWAAGLYAKVGDSGTPVNVGASGGFVSGVAGRLYLGPNTGTYTDNVDAIIQVDDPVAVGILPTLNLAANPTQLPADGKSTSVLSGKVMYGQYPGVGVTVNLSATLGTVSPVSPVTGADGSYQATFTAGTQGGTATVSATYKNLTQKANMELTGQQIPVLLAGVVINGNYSHSLEVKSDGTVWAWGNNNFGQLGDGTTINHATPVQVKNLTGVVAVAAGYYHSLALKSDGTVWAWGSNHYGQLGDGTTTDRYTPVQVQNLTDVVAVAANDFYSLALKSDGTVWAWGDNSYGRLGDGTTTNRTVPVQVKNLTSVVAIAAGSWHPLALKSDGT